MATLKFFRICSNILKQRKVCSLNVQQKLFISSGTYFPDTPLNFVNGRRVECERGFGCFPVEEPATGKVLCIMPGSAEEDVNHAVECAKNAQPAWGELSGLERMRILDKAAILLKEKKEELARLEVYDTGKPIWETRLDVQTAIDALEYYSGLAPTLCGQHFVLPSGSFAYTRREPLGVVAGIGAWNYPIQVAMWKSAPALACGNAVVYKPSQFTPLSAVKIGEIFTKSGLPNGLYNVVQGGSEVGNCLTSHPDIAKVTFTGSVPTGAKVMQSCGKGIKHVTLELGGKSPLIIFDDADIENAVNGALIANFLSQGQVCSNGTRVFIHESIFEQVVSKLVERTIKIKPGDPHHETTKTGAMINAEHARKVLNYIEGAKGQGAEVLCGGQLLRPPTPVLNGKYISPCIIRVSDEMRISKEEVFGPVMNVYSFKSEEEVLERANDTDFGLAAGLFTKNLNRAHRVASKLEAGICYVNNYNLSPPEIPFGGFKKSGIGKENGTVAIEHFTQLKTVYVEANDIECPL